MKDDKKEDQLTHQQKYCLCLECCFWAYQLVVVALALVVMGRTIMAYQQTRDVLNSDSYRHAEETVWLWNQGYIIDIKVEKTNNCPEGYQPLINYEWPGSGEGCFCVSNANGYNFNFVLEGKCTSQLISLGCDTIDSMSPQVLNMWKGSSLLCLKRADKINFYNSVLTEAPVGGTSSSMTVCSVDKNYQVYTLPGVPCPVSALSNTSLGVGQTSLPLDTNSIYKLNFVSQSGYPVANIKLSQYNFCQFYNDSNISPNKEGTYILQNIKLAQPCPTNDPRMVTIDNLNEQDFYTNNTRVYQLISSLPAYPTPSVDYQYKLGYIPYPSWTFACRNSQYYSLPVATTHILFQDSSNALELTTGLVIPCALILVILFRLFYIIRHLIDFKNKSTYNVLNVGNEQIIEQIPNLDIQKSYKKECVLFLLELTLLGVMFGAIVYSIYVLTDDSRWIKQIIKNQCTDSYLQNIFTYYEDSIDQTADLLIEAAIVWGCLFIVHIIYFCTRNKAGDLYNIKENVIEQVSSQSQEPVVDILEKEGKIEGVNLQDSSELALNKKESSNSELQIFDMDYLMGQGAGETKDNFFSLDREASLNVVTKKKKKKPAKNRKSLFKDK